MQRIIARLLAACMTLIVAFAVVLGFGEVLEAVGDLSAAAVCGYVALGLAMLWVVGQILLVASLGLWVLRQPPPAMKQPHLGFPETQGEEGYDEEESSLSQGG